MSKEPSKRFHLRASNKTALPLTRSPAIRALLEKKQKEDTRGNIVLGQEERDKLLQDLIEEHTIRVQSDPRPKPDEMTTYPAFGDRWYEGVRVKTIDERALSKKTKDKHTEPDEIKFMDMDGAIYDRFYRKVEDDPSLEKLGNPRFTELPDAENFNNYYEFEQELLTWYSDCSALLEGIKLPHIVGRSYARPMVPKKREDDDPNVPYVSKSRREMEDVDEPEDMEDLIYDPWDATLYPEEPNPYLYKTEEEYEEAMCRWALICSNLPAIPPHPSQFEDLLKLSIAKTTKDTGRKEDAQKIREKQEREYLLKVLIRYEYDFSKKYLNYVRIPQLDKLRGPVSPYDEQLVEAIRDVQTESVERIDRGDEDEDEEEYVDDSVEDKLLFRMIRTQNSFANAPLPVTSKIGVSFKKLLDIQEYKLQKYGSYQKHILPLTHGTLPKDLPEGAREPFSMSKPASKQSKLFSEPLRRTDLSGPMRAECLDSPAKCHGMTVEFNMPKFWPGALNFSKLEQELITENYDENRFKPISYLEALKKDVVSVDNGKRLDWLNSWYYPKRKRDMIGESKVRLENAIFKQEPSIEGLCELLKSDFYLDVCQNLMSLVNDDEENEQQISNISILLKVVDEYNFRMIVELFERSNDTGSLRRNALVAYFVTETLQQSARAKEIIQSTIEGEDIEALYWIAYSTTFFSEGESDMFEFHPDVMTLSCQVYGESFENTVRAILITYYLSVLSESISVQTFLYVSINNMVLELIRAYSEQIAQLIEDDPLFITQAILGIGHNTCVISTFNLFLMSMLIKGVKSSRLSEMLKADSTDLLKNVHDLLNSKFSHTRYACRLLYKHLCARGMIEYTFTNYVKDGFFLESLKDDGPGKPSAKLTFKQEIVLGMFKTYFRTVTEEKRMDVMKLLESDVFHNVLSALKKKADSKNKIGGSVVACAEFLAVLTRMLCRLELITGKTMGEGEGKYMLCVTLEDINVLFGTILGYPEKIYAVRTPLVVCLRQVLKPDKVFDLIRRQTQYYEKILGLCKGSKDNAEFSRECWRLFYQSIRYHVGAIDIMLKQQNILGQFLEAVNPSIGNIIMLNGLHYIGKLFAMAQNEQRRQLEGKKVARDDIKTMEKEVRSMVDFFIKKHRFISLHMIYKRFTTPRSDGSQQLQFPGAPFHSLFALYDHLSSSPSCAKLLKDAKKNAEYGEGLTKIVEMSQMPPEATEFQVPMGTSDKFKKQELRKTHSRHSFSTR